MELLLPPRSAFQQSGLSIASSHSFLTSDNVSARSNGGSSTPLMQISALFEHLKRSVLEQAPQRSTEHSNPGQVIPAQAKEVTQISRRRPSKRMRVANKIFDATSPSKKNLSDAHVKGTVRFSTKLSNPNHDHMELEPLDYGGEKELNNAHSDDVVNTSLNAFSSPKQAVPIALISDSEEKDKQFMDSFITPQPLRRNHEMTSSPDPMEMEPLDHGTEHELSDMPSDVAVSTNFNDYTAPLNDEIDHTAEPSQPIFETNPANSLESIKTNKRIARPKRKRKAPLNRRRATLRIIENNAPLVSEVRRGERLRIPPLQFWKGERIDYARSKRAGFDQIISSPTLRIGNEPGIKLDRSKFEPVKQIDVKQTSKSKKKTTATKISNLRMAVEENS